MHLQIELLKQAVELLGPSGLTKPPVSEKKSGPKPGAKAKIPWKKVAEYIEKNGGSYRFGNATCRKKWDEIQEEDT